MFKFHKGLLLIKTHYVLYYSGMGPLCPFIPSILRSMGLSDSIIGIYYLCSSICGMIVKIWFGALADKYKKQRFFFLFFLITTFLSVVGITLMPATLTKPYVQLKCSSAGTNFTFCSNDKIAEREKNIFLEQNLANIKCQLNCHSEGNSFNFANEICNSWGVEEFCQEPNQVSKTNQRQSFVLDENNRSYIYSNPPSNQLNVFRPDNFQFSTFISTNQSFESNKCMYFTLSQAEFKREEALNLTCSTYETEFCDVECDNAAFKEMWLQSEASRATVKDSEAFRMPLFWILFSFLILNWASIAIVSVIGDTICFNLLGGKPEEFGKSRLWASVGWGISSFVSGNLADYFNEGKAHLNYHPLMYISLCMFLLDFPFACQIKHAQSIIPVSILKDVGKLLRKPRILVFTLWCIVSGLLSGLAWNFIFLYLEDLANAREEKEQRMKTLQGLVIAVQSFGGEVPFLFLSGRIIKFLGHINTMSLILFVFGVRFTLLSFVYNPWYILPIEVMNGLTYGLLTSAMNSYGSIIAPPGSDATMQGLVGSVFEGIGVSIGSLISGTLFDKYSGRTTYRIFALGAFVAFVVHVLIQYIIQYLFCPETERPALESKRKDLAPGLVSLKDEKKDEEEEN